MGVSSGCGEQEAGVASGSGWNLWVWLLCVVVRRYIDFLILLILINPRRACVCLSVCLSVCYRSSCFKVRLYLQLTITTGFT